METDFASMPTLNTMHLTETNNKVIHQSESLCVSVFLFVRCLYRGTCCYLFVGIMNIMTRL